jgi:uncharacterized protein YjaZ
MLNDIRWLTPLPPSLLEALVAYELTRRFYQEVQYREELAEYCQWYQEIAAKNRLEMQRMQGDINLLGWFNRMWSR